VFLEGDACGVLMIKVTDDITISEGDIIYRFTRSSGPGGQNVNKLNTRVTLLFDITGSRSLTNEQKRLLFSRLFHRISNEGFLTIVSQRHRTQRANRRAAKERLIDLLSDALREIPVRKATSTPYAAKKDRLRRKRRRSEIKQMRKPVVLQ
jgi:ribosome-associated protein